MRFYCTLLWMLLLPMALGAALQATREANVYGDPHIVAFNGERFEFNGIAGSFFSMWSSKQLQVNVGLATFGHQDSTFLQAIGVVMADNLLASIITPSNCTQGHPAQPLNVTLNGDQVHPGQMLQIRTPRGKLTVEFDEVILDSQGPVDYATVMIRTPVLQLKVSRAPNSCHLDMSASVMAMDDPEAVQGVLGRTVQCAASQGAPCPPLGDESAHLVSGLFAFDAPTNQFDPVAVPVKKAGRALLMTYFQP